VLFAHSKKPAARNVVPLMGHNASREARAELRRGGTRLIGSVAYFPERYGDGIVSVAVDMLNQKPVPPAVRKASTGHAGQRRSSLPQRRVFGDYRKLRASRLPKTAGWGYFKTGAPMECAQQRECNE
jgi:hypothetical protein